MKAKHRVQPELAGDHHGQRDQADPGRQRQLVEDVVALVKALDAEPGLETGGPPAVRRALERAGLPGDERSATTFAEQWRPYRAYALQYLWAGALTASGDTTKNYEKEAVA